LVTSQKAQNLPCSTRQRGHEGGDGTSLWTRRQRPKKVPPLLRPEVRERFGLSDREPKSGLAVC